MTTDIKHIDEVRLETDLAYRFGYLAEFVNLTQEEIDSIHAAAAHLAPLVPAIVDAVYVQLFKYDATKRHFVPRQSGYTGLVPESIDALSPDHEQIQFRKQHLGTYLKRLVTAPYDARMMTYLDNVGKMHTPKLGSKTLDVPLVQMNALMGFVSDALLGIIFDLPLETATKRTTLRAFNKLLWIQNDLIVRHYAA